MRKRHEQVAIIVVMVIACVVTGVLSRAEAAESSVATEPDTTSGEVASVVVSPLTDEPTATDTSRMVAGAGCRRVTGAITGKNVVGQMLWKFTQKVEWCWNAAHTKVTYRWQRATGATYYVGWDYEGLMPGSKVNATGAPYKVYNQGKFQQCLPLPWGETCPWKAFPFHEWTMRANGTIYGEGGY